MAEPPLTAEELAKRLRDLTIIKSVDLAATVIFLWDYLLTVGMEVEHIWPGRWTVVKVIFLIQRYVPFLDIMWFGMHVSFGSNMSEVTCYRLNDVGKPLALIGLLASEIVLCFRVWAVWNRNKVMMFTLPILFAGCWVPPIVFLVIFMKSVVFTEIAPPFLGCVVLSADQIIALSWVFLVIWDALILMLMLVPALKALKYSGHTALFRTVYGEGIIYYFYLFVISLVNLLLNRNASIDVPYRFLAVAYVFFPLTFFPLPPPTLSTLTVFSLLIHPACSAPSMPPSHPALLHIRAQIKRGQLHGLGSMQFSGAQSMDYGNIRFERGSNRKPMRIAIAHPGEASTVMTAGVP
ncbi:hypothetical protein NLJ89_g10680 [Agrocybe chaxingu]|uniref:DUF6533 domain-containing protein n=1 Tax=Agrocybe chaxingu TaxID=84603 RepID=A0A9W8JXP2_9AGAR|nr:hypothetical protein NLJ89_g10680 [Agrocybe chaxingu]